MQNNNPPTRGAAFFAHTPITETNPEALRTLLLNMALNGPQGPALDFFNDYFEKGGHENHPILGDLNVFRKEITASWNQQAGVNTVAMRIQSALNPESMPPSIFRFN